MSDSSLPINTDLRLWVIANLSWDGWQYVCDDGTPFETARLALHAASSVDHHDVAAGILEHCKLLGKICPRCVQRVPMRVYDSKFHRLVPASQWWHLCYQCAWPNGHLDNAPASRATPCP